MSDSTSPAQSSPSPVDATTTSPTTSPSPTQTQSSPVTTDSSTPTTPTQSSSSTPTPTSTEPTTTTSNSPEPTSSPQLTSTPQSSTNASSDDRTSPSSASTFSSPLSPSASTRPSTSSSSSHTETLTTITSSYTTYVSGSPIVTTTPIPSTIPQLSAASSSNRSAIIAGSAAGGTAVIILLLSLAFVARRKRFKKLRFLDTIMLRRNRIRSRATLLDGDEIPEIDPEPTPRRYTDYEAPRDGMSARDGTERALMAGETVGAALTAAPHWSETGSAFREDLWPPPGEASRLMDPLANRDDLDLGRIVDDVMGAPVAAVHFSDQSISSAHRGSVRDSEAVARSRTVSSASHAALLEAAGLAGSLSTVPVRSSRLVQPGTGPETVS